MTKVLVVDDNSLGRMLVSGVLAAAKVPGLEIMQARDAVEAAIVIERNPIDLLFTDMHMNEISGLQLIQRLRKAGHSLPIVVVTMEESPDVLKKLLDAGATMVISKRAPPAELQKALELAGAKPG